MISKQITMLTTALATTLALTIAGTASAGGHNRDGANQMVDYAKVTKVTPVYETIEKKIPKENCWMERVRNEPPRRKAPRKPIIAGALIGGAIGNAVGHQHDNKHAGILVGSLIGASIGRDIADRRDARRPRDERISYIRVEHCEVEYIIKTEQELVGYDVSYKYGNQVFHTEMDRHPGKKIKVAVNVSPVYF